MIVVSNTGPLIALAKISRLDLLRKLGWSPVLIPPVIKRELFGRMGAETAVLEAALEEWIEVRRPTQINKNVEEATAPLDQGERQAVQLAASIEGKVALLIDDRAGRRAARSLGIPVVGVLGVLIAAKRRDLIPAFRPLAEELRRRGYWISDALVNEASRKAEES